MSIVQKSRSGFTPRSPTSGSYYGIDFPSAFPTCGVPTVTTDDYPSCMLLNWRTKTWYSDTEWPSYSGRVPPTRQYTDYQYLSTAAYAYRQVIFAPLCGDKQTTSGHGHYRGYSASNLPINNAIVNGAKSKCLGKLTQEKMNLGAFVGEIRQTQGMLRNTVIQLTQAILAAKRLDARRLASVLGIVPRNLSHTNWWEMWLSARYGWVPLLSDVRSAAIVAANHFVNSPIIRKVTAWEENESSWEKTTTAGALDFKKGSTVSGTIMFGNGTVYSGSKLERGDAGLYVSLRPDASSLLADTYITDPASIIWQLMPGSFLFDWVVGVGEYLENLRALDGYNVYGGYSSYTGTIQGSFSPKVVQPTNGEVTCATAPAFERYYRRDPWTGAAPPIRWGPLLNMNRLLDAFALLSTALNRKPK